MAERDKTNCQLRAEQLTDADIDEAADFFRSRLDDRLAAGLNSCVHCGLCAESCHYYLATGNPAFQPALKVKLLQSVYRARPAGLRGLLARLSGAETLSRATLAQWVDILFGSCTGCGRCTLNCAVGVQVSRLVRAGRSTLASLALVPGELQSTVDTAVKSGNNMGIATSEWLETAQWIEEELQNETGDQNAKIPIDRSGAELLYTVNPREIKFFPLSLLAAAKVLHASGESWTFSSSAYDVTNYGLFSGDDVAASLIASRLRQSMRDLQARTLVLGECGHGFGANRWEASAWLGAAPGFEIKSIVQIMAGLIRQ